MNENPYHNEPGYEKRVGIIKLTFCSRLRAVTVRFLVNTGTGVKSTLDFRQRIKELHVGSSFGFMFLLHCFL